MKIDSCLISLNKAYAIDENYFNVFLYQKSKFLTFRKDSEESIKNKKKVVETKPTIMETQRSHFFFDIDAMARTKTEKNNIEITRVLLIKTDSNNFNLE
jgi:hypothetical protein